MRLSSPLVNMASLTSWIFGWNMLYLCSGMYCIILIRTNITLIIDGLIENDRTTVQCTAFGLVNGSPQFYNCSVHTLFIQGIKFNKYRLIRFKFYLDYFIYACAYVRTYIHTYIHTCMHNTYIIHTYVCTYVRMYVHTYVCMYIHMYIHTYTYVRTYINTYVHTDVHHTYVRMYICTVEYG